MPQAVETLSDEDLVIKCQGGDLLAFEELYRRYHRPILAYIYQITRNYDDSACIAQDVFLKVFENVGRFDTSRRFSTWFYTIARNASIDYLQSRRRKVMVTFSDLDREEGDDTVLHISRAVVPDVESRMNRLEAQEALRESLAALPQIYREIIELVVFQEMSYADASVILGNVSLGTLRSRMFHALRNLRLFLATKGGREGQDLI